MSQKPQLFSGARGLIQYGSGTNPKTLAIATDISVSTRNNLRPSYVVGSMNPISIEPLSIDVDCSIGRLIPVNEPTTSGTEANKAAMKNTTAIDLDLEEKIVDILKSETIDIIISDRTTGTIVAVVKEARFTGRSSSLSSGDVAQERLNFVGIYVSYGTDGDLANSGNPTGYETY